MSTPANALNIKQEGIQYFDGTATFTGIDGSTATFVLTSNGVGIAPSFQASSGGSSSWSRPFAIMGG